MELNSSNSQKQPIEDDKELTFSKEFFYNTQADTTVRLKDGKILKFNKSSLVSSSRSNILHQIFFGSLRQKEGATDIPDCDYDSFKLFLDCIMGYKTYTYANAFQIFPIAWKYQVQNVINKCINAFKERCTSTYTSTSLLDLLNMVAFLGCDTLINQTVENIFRVCNLYQFFKKNDHLKLDIDAIKVILSAKSELIDSQILENLVSWAENYMKNETLSQRLEDFLEKYELLQFFKLEYFETAGAILEFYNSDLGKKIFSVEQMLSCLKDSVTLRHGTSKWVEMGIGHEISDKIQISLLSMFALNKPFHLTIKIERNKVATFLERSYPVGAINGIQCYVVLVGENENHSSRFMGLQKKLFFHLSDSPNNTEKLYCMTEKDAWMPDFKVHKLKFFLQLTWSFSTNCRILLTNQPGDELNDPEKLFFTKNISIHGFNTSTYTKF